MKDFIIVFLIGLMIYLIMMTESFAYPDCKLYTPYRCVPVYGNEVKCGCGL